MFFHYIDLSWRSFKRTPLITLLMVVAIAIGIGVTMMSLSVYHMMSMDPMPHKSDKVHPVQLNTRDDGSDWWSKDDLPQQITYQDAVNLYRADIPAIKTPSYRTGYSLHLGDDNIKPFIESVRVTGLPFFQIFDIEFVEGQPWTQQQENNAEMVTVISRALSERLFGKESGLGQQVYYDQHLFRIIGIFDNFDHHIKYYDLTNGDFSKHEHAFIPFSLTEPLKINNWGNTNGWKFQEIRTFEDKLQSEQHWVQFWVQLDNKEQYQDYHGFLNNYLIEQEAKGRFEREEPAFAMRNLTEWLDYNDVVTEDNRVLVAMSFMFLSVCLANILGLLLGKFLKRVPEIGVRRALGASKRDVFAQHIVEVSMLGVFGGILGVGLAQLGLWGVRATYSYYSELATMDLTMFFSAPIIAMTACILAGLFPAYLVCKTNPAICLKTQ
ncbi:MAG: ABC transporter permease [Pseudomonadota bacterium]